MQIGKEMEIKIGKLKVDGRTIEKYCSYNQKNFGRNLNDSQKKSIVKERVEELNKTEWQRWTPFLGFGRMWGDMITSDYVLLNKMYSTTRNMTNIFYNSLTFSLGFVTPIAYYFAK